jgi:hypothetical protein
VLPSREMRMVFRKHLEDLNGEWHFRPDCPLWPKVNYHENDRLEDRDHICKECIRLQTGFSAHSLFIFKFASCSVLNSIDEFSRVLEIIDPASLMLSVLVFVAWQAYKRSKMSVILGERAS